MLSTHHLKVVSTVALTFQTAAYVLVARQSRIPDAQGHLYKTSTAVFLMELTKACVASIVVAIRAYQSGKRGHLRDEDLMILGSDLEEAEEGVDEKDRPVQVDGVPTCTMDTAFKETIRTLLDPSGLPLLYPATAYAVQNVLQLSAATYLQPAIFQVFNQAKLVMTAFFSYLILKRALTRIQWVSIVMLAAGLALVHLTSDTHGLSTENRPNIPKGSALMLIVAILSGFAGVYTELMLKKGGDFWVTNAQMAGMSLVPATIMIVTESIKAGNGNLFEYFGTWATSAVLMNSAGGILVSMVLKYADSIVKGFSLAAAVLLITLVNAFFLDAHFSSGCIFGILVVIGSVTLYNSSAKQLGMKKEGLYDQNPSSLADQLMKNASSRPGELKNLDDEHVDCLKDGKSINRGSNPQRYQAH